MDELRKEKCYLLARKLGEVQEAKTKSIDWIYPNYAEGEEFKKLLVRLEAEVEPPVGKSGWLVRVDDVQAEADDVGDALVDCALKFLET